MATVGDVMTTDILAVPSTATLGEVARQLRARNVGSAIVVDAGEQPLGLITERELVDSVAASRNPDHGQAGSWLREQAGTVERSASLDEASTRMRDAGVRHLTVTEDGRLVGIVSIRDLLVGTL
jgi:signal-transduction protein with cAMP-binding, CBS, and nucleotidyltransferase domain